MSCRFPFACSTTSCERCATPDRFEAGAELRRSVASINRQSVIVGAVCFLSIFALGFIGAAVIDIGRDNIKNWMVANEPT